MSSLITDEQRLLGTLHLYLGLWTKTFNLYFGFGNNNLSFSWRFRKECMQGEILNLLATQKVLQVGSQGYNLINSLSISVFLSCFIEKKYFHGNMGTYITFLWVWRCSKTFGECTHMRTFPLQPSNNKSLVLAMGFTLHIKFSTGFKNLVGFTLPPPHMCMYLLWAKVAWLHELYMMHTFSFLLPIIGYYS